MLGLSSQNTILIVSFKLNQKYIASAFCENRNTTAEKVCNGTCYLEDRLVENNDVKDNESLPALKEVRETVLFMNVVSVLDTPDDNSNCEFFCLNDHSPLSGYSSAIFHPPEA